VILKTGVVGGVLLAVEISRAVKAAIAEGDDRAFVRLTDRRDRGQRWVVGVGLVADDALRGRDRQRRLAGGDLLCRRRLVVVVGRRVDRYVESAVSVVALRERDIETGVVRVRCPVECKVDRGHLSVV